MPDSKDMTRYGNFPMRRNRLERRMIAGGGAAPKLRRHVARGKRRRRGARAVFCIRMRTAICGIA
jgi:hypothetical protein